MKRRSALLSIYRECWSSFIDAFKESPALALAPFHALIRRQELAESEGEMKAWLARGSTNAAQRVDH